MCNFVPGQAIAIGPMGMLLELGAGLPGELGKVQPLVSEETAGVGAPELASLGSVVLKTDPGLELYAVSRLSARLAARIEKKEAVVDLNHILPLAAEEPFSPTSLRLSPHAELEVHAVRRLLRSALPAQATPTRVAVLDSGLAPGFSGFRAIRYSDYSWNGRLRRDTEPADPLGHGTRVVAILDQILPPQVELVVGRLPSDPGALTALTVAHALGDVIAREQPEVVNLSIAPRNDWFICPKCKHAAPAPTFMSTMLPLIVRLGGKSAARTITVMASGNTGQIPNSRWLTDDVETLLFAVAENRRGERTRYSSAPEGPLGDMFSAGAFGGDDPDDQDAQGVFTDGTHGTSFAAPFITAVALLTKNLHAIAGSGSPPKSIGVTSREILDAARHGRFLHPQPAGGKAQ